MTEATTDDNVQETNNVVLDENIPATPGDTDPVAVEPTEEEEIAAEQQRLAEERVSQRQGAMQAVFKEIPNSVVTYTEFAMENPKLITDELFIHNFRNLHKAVCKALHENFKLKLADWQEARLDRMGILGLPSEFSDSSTIDGLGLGLGVTGSVAVGIVIVYYSTGQMTRFISEVPLA